jgi:hypothetical protein
MINLLNPITPLNPSKLFHYSEHPFHHLNFYSMSRFEKCSHVTDSHIIE